MKGPAPLGEMADSRARGKIIEYEDPIKRT
jgi:hypothetical protein